MQDRSEHRRGRPVVALMGEFSAGKSTLANLLIDEGMSPVRVTATQMPPIWYTYGSGDTLRVDLEGRSTVVSPEALEEVSVEDTAYVLVRSQAQVLQLMDIIDMPGISDPNLSSESWQRTIHNADVVIWCSHATQAWRQSEAATWSALPDAQRANGMLLLTRFDKLLNENDQRRVLARVRAETDGQFKAVFPISLLAASDAGEDREVWERSGAEAFMQALLDTVFDLTEAAGPDDGSPPSSVALAAFGEAPPPRADDATAASPSVMPRRVRAQKAAGETTSRPPRDSVQEFLI